MKVFFFSSLDFIFFRFSASRVCTIGNTTNGWNEKLRQRRNRIGRCSPELDSSIHRHHHHHHRCFSCCSGLAQEASSRRSSSVFFTNIIITTILPFRLGCSSRMYSKLRKGHLWMDGCIREDIHSPQSDLNLIPTSSSREYTSPLVSFQ